MTYVPGFENDIYISYAQVDDIRASHEKSGWVTQFQKYLERLLAQRLGRMGAVRIWRDRDAWDGSDYFKEDIEQAVKGSAVFLALNSPGYLAPESYSRKELALFCENAEAGPYGVVIGSRLRILNVLLYNIPSREWPPEIASFIGFPFYDAREYDSPGHPSEPGSEKFFSQMHSLVDTLAITLQAFKSLAETAEMHSPPPARPAPPASAHASTFRDVAPDGSVFKRHGDAAADAASHADDAPSRIFICYRRVPGVGHAAGRLYDRLAEQFGDERVFMDISAIDMGEDFVEAITRELSSCRLMVVLIHRGWADAKEPDGRRLHEEGDFVRMEVSAALKRGIRVVPVLLDGAPMPRAEELPEDLRALARRNAFKMSGESWTRDVGELLARMKRQMQE